MPPPIRFENCDAYLFKRSMFSENTDIFTDLYALGGVMTPPYKG